LRKLKKKEEKMKKLKAKKVDIAVCWNGLRKTPPKEFSTIDDISSAGEVLKVFRGAVPEFVGLMEEGEKIALKIGENKATTEERQAFATRSRKIEEEEGGKEIEIELGDQDFNAFFQQFERWGRDWFFKLESYLAFREKINECNRQPKDKDVKSK
jgi:hypothetical protein